MPRKVAKHRIQVYVGGRMRTWEKGQVIDLDLDTIRQVIPDSMLEDKNKTSKGNSKKNGDS